MVGEVFLRAVRCPAALKLLKPFPVPGLEGSSASMPMYPGAGALTSSASDSMGGERSSLLSIPYEWNPGDHPQLWKTNPTLDLHLGRSG